MKISNSPFALIAKKNFCRMNTYLCPAKLSSVDSITLKGELIGRGRRLLNPRLLLTEKAKNVIVCFRKCATFPHITHDHFHGLQSVYLAP